MSSDEPALKEESSNDDLIDLTRLSHEEILELAKGKYGKRDEDRSKWSIQCDMDSIQNDIIRYLRIGIEWLFGIMIYFGPVLADPLFLHIPIINENIKCLVLDEKLKFIAIVLRSFTDLPFLLKLIRHVLPTWCTWSFLEAYPDDLMPESPILNILAVLPIPQIVILSFLPTTRKSKSLNRMKILNSLIVLQYVPRAYSIYTTCTALNKDTRERSREFAKRRQIWIPGLINFIMYILASHVFGAFWYFFSVQREMDCWISNCQSENGCDLNTLQCDNTIFRNVTLLNDLCPTNPPNPMVTFNCL